MSESKASNNMKAVLILAKHKNLGPILTPALNIERDSINWDRFGYAGQSGGVQVALSWAYCLFCDEVPPKDWGYRDPFQGFFSLDRDIQVLILQAMATRNDFISLSVEDRPKSSFEKMYEEIGAKLEKEEKRKGFQVVRPSDED